MGLLSRQLIMLLMMLCAGICADLTGPAKELDGFQRFIRQFHDDHHLPESYLLPLVSTGEFIPLPVDGFPLENFSGEIPESGKPINAVRNAEEAPAVHHQNQLDEPVWQVVEVEPPVTSAFEQPTVETPTTERVFFVQQAPEDYLYTSTQLPFYSDDLVVAVTELNEQSVRPPYEYEQPARQPYEQTARPYNPQSYVTPTTERAYPAKNPDEYLFRVPDEELFGSGPPRYSDEEHQGNNVGFRREYAKIRSIFDDGFPSHFPDRIFGSPPTSAQLKFPSVSSTEENWHFDVDWDGLFGSHRRKRHSSLPPTNAHSRKDVEYEGPYIYTQLFGPPYEVGYIRSPVPSKHVYEDYLQFVKSWTAANRDNEEDGDSTSSSTKYRQTTTTRKAPAYKEPVEDVKEEDTASTYKDSYKNEDDSDQKSPIYKEDNQEYKEEESQQKEKNLHYLPTSYKEDKYEGYRAPVYKESVEKPRTEYYLPPTSKPYYQSTTPKAESSYPEQKSAINPQINYHTMEDYVAPETEFRPPKHPFYYRQKPQVQKETYKPSTTAKYHDPSPATTYRPTPGNEPRYEILRPFQQRVKPSTEKPYIPTSPKYVRTEPSTTAAYEQPKYLPPKYSEPPVSDSHSTNYEQPKYDILRPFYQPQQAAKSVYYEPPVTTTAKYEPTKPYVKKYQSPPTRQPEPPNRYVEPPQYEDKAAYEAPNRYVEPPTYAAPLPIVTYKPSLETYAVAAPTTTPNYKEAEAGSSYSADSYQSKQVPYEESHKKEEDSYTAPTSSTPKKRYPVIIGRYQVTDSAVFQPKKVSGSSSEGSHIHGANGEEYVVYYLPYGQPLPVPIRRKRNVPVEKSWVSLADSVSRRRYRGQRLLTEDPPVLSPKEAHKLMKQQMLAAEHREIDDDESSINDAADPEPVTEPMIKCEKISGSNDEKDRPNEVEEEIEEVTERAAIPLDQQEDDLSTPKPTEEIAIASLEDEPEIPIDFTAPFLITPAEPTIVTPEEPLLPEAPDVILEEFIPAIPDVNIDEIIPTVPDVILEEGGVSNANFESFPPSKEITVQEGEKEELGVPISKPVKVIASVEDYEEDGDYYEHDAILPGLTQRPVQYIKPPGLASDKQEHWGGYTTWWTKLGNRIARVYNYE